MGRQKSVESTKSMGEGMITPRKSDGARINMKAPSGNQRKEKAQMKEKTEIKEKNNSKEKAEVDPHARTVSRSRTRARSRDAGTTVAGGRNGRATSLRSGSRAHRAGTVYDARNHRAGTVYDTRNHRAGTVYEARKSGGLGAEQTSNLSFSQKWEDFEDSLYNFLEKPTSSRYAFGTAIVFVLCILCSTFTFALSTTDRLKDSEVIFILEVMFTIIFTVEFLMRVLSRLSYPHDLFFDPMAWGDFLAILPFYVEIAIARDDLNFLRIARVFRIIKMSRYYYGSQILARAMDLSVAPLCVTMFFFSLTVIFFGTTLYYMEGIGETEHPEDFNSIPKCMWFTMLISTAGVGEEVPNSTFGKALMLASIICGIFFIAMPLAVIGNNFTKVWDEKERMLLIIALRAKMDEMQIDELAVYNTFLKQDVERSGTLDYFQFKSAIFELVPDCEPGHLKQVFKSFDVEKENEISLNALWITMFPEMRNELIDLDDEYDEENELSAHVSGAETPEGLDTNRTLESGVSATSHDIPAHVASKKMNHRDIVRLVGTIEKSLQQNRVSNNHVEERIAKLEKGLRVQAKETEEVIDKLSYDMQLLVESSAELFKKVEMLHGINEKCSVFSQSALSVSQSHASHVAPKGSKWTSNFMTTLGLCSKSPSDFTAIKEDVAVPAPVLHDTEPTPNYPISPTFLPTFNFFMDWNSGHALASSPEHQEEYMDEQSNFTEEYMSQGDHPSEALEAGNAESDFN